MAQQRVYLPKCARHFADNLPYADLHSQHRPDTEKGILTLAKHLLYMSTLLMVASLRPPPLFSSGRIHFRWYTLVCLLFMKGSFTLSLR